MDRPLFHKYRMRYSEINEVEVGGGIELGDFPDNLPDTDMSSKQLDLFKTTPSGEPNVPPNLKLKGRMGEFYVAEREPKTPEEKAQASSKGAKCFVWILDGTAAAYIWLTPYTREHMNYPQDMSYKPDLHGTGLRASAVFVAPEFRGQDLGPKIYQWVLTNVCDYIMADAMQTHGGVKLWQRLRQMKQFVVHVWDGDKYFSRQRRTGKDFNHVYNVSHLIPWVTLRSKLDKVLDAEEEEDW